MRASQLLLPTVKEDPAGAEAISHKLMVRAGLVRQLAAGIYVFHVKNEITGEEKIGKFAVLK